MNPILFDMIKTASLPELVPVRRHYPDTALADVEAAVARTMNASGLRIPKQDTIAVTVGSRGIANLPIIVAATVNWFKQQELAPFIVPAMGSHGGGTAEGQIRALRELGITEESTGCPIRSSMDVIQTGTLPEGFP
ncbi:MAG: hypothetical protein LBO64_01795, partial [Desulfovibrio sp.]|nr:hypothetical protein [Desulfovibrio sp.]